MDEEVYRRNVALVYQVCYLYLKNPADAEDAVQTVFLKYLKAHVNFQDGGRERAWLVTTAKNCCRDLLKSRWHRQRVPIESLPEPIAESADDRIRSLMELLFSLPEKHRVVMYLYYIEGYSIRELAAILNRKESTIRSQLLRGRAKLKQDLGGDFFE